MEDYKHSHPLSRKIPNGTAKSPYDDVFGGPPKYSAGPFPPRSDDYAEIFSGLADSCSIPVLDLPPAIDDGFEAVNGSSFDYFEIFGGLDPGDFAVSYEELFAEPQNSSSSRRSLNEAVARQQEAVVAEFPLEGPTEYHVLYLEKDQSSSIGAAVCPKKDQLSSDGAGHPFNNGSKQWNMSSQRNREDASNGTPHITEIRAVPGITFVVDTSPSSKGTEITIPTIQVSNDASVNAVSDGAITEKEHFRKVKLPSPSCTSMLGPGNDLKVGQKELGIKLAAFEDAPTNEHYHSCSSSNSTSSGDRSFSALSTNEVNMDVDGLTEAKLSRNIMPPISCCNKISGTDLIADQEQSNTRLTSSEDAPEHEPRHSCSSSNNSISSGDRFFPDYSTNDISLDAYSDGGKTEATHFRKTVSPTSSYCSTRCSAIDLKDDQKKLATICTTLENASANEKHHSYSPSNHSRSTWGRSYSNNIFLTVSDISLQTEASHLPPPSRPPPKSGRQGHSKVMMAAKKKSDLDERNVSRHVGCHQILHRGGSFETHLLRKTAKNGSPPFFDVEVDASSAAAAIKEAMEQAQVRLKSAKESMERKKENLESRKRLGLDEGIQCKENKAAQETHRFNEEIAQQTCERKVNQVKVSAEERHNKSIGETKLASELEEKEMYLELTEETRQAMQGEESRSSKLVCQQNDRGGEWKVERQFYELIQNEQFKKVQEVLGQEVDKNKETKKANEKGQNGEKSAKVVHDLKNVKLMTVNEVFEQENSDFKLKEANVACEEIKEISKVTLQSYVQEESKNKHNEVLGACYPQKNEQKVVEAQKIVHTLQEKILRASQEACLFKGSEKKVKVAKEVCKFKEEVNKLRLSKEDHGCGESEKEMDAINKSCGWEEGKVKFEVVNKGFEMDKIGNEVKRHPVSCEVGVELKTAQGVHDDECKIVGSEKGACCHEKIEAKLAEVKVVIEKDESNKLNAKEETCEWQDHTKDINMVEEALLNNVNEKKMEAKTESCQRVSSDKIYRETCDDLQQNEKKQKPNEVVCKLDKIESKLMTDRGPLAQIENKNVKEVNDTLDCKENTKIFKDAQVVSDRTQNENKLEHIQEANLLEEQVGTLKIAQEDPRSQDTESTDSRIPEICETEERTKAESTARERKQEMEQVRILEEKEREREREKDRLAVERATREAHEGAFTEARERAERVAVERVTAEARQRALAEAREKAEKASADALEKSLAEKASREARLRAERAAVERATVEARERAVERALAEKAAQEARERAARSNVTSRDRQRKDNEVEGHIGSSSNEDGGVRRNSGFSDMQDSAHNSQFRNMGSPSSSYQRHSDSSNHASNGKFEGSEGESVIRCKARLERHQRTVERAAKALAEKNSRDALAQREQVERNRLAETLGADVRRWSGGKEGNLRALLSTLQYILGPESGWQPIPLTDVITAVAVKKAYRKATLCVHPDKLQQRGASIQHKYVCEKVFDLLKEAWNRFNSEER